MRILKPLESPKLIGPEVSPVRFFVKNMNSLNLLLNGMTSGLVGYLILKKKIGTKLSDYFVFPKIVNSTGLSLTLRP